MGFERSSGILLHPTSLPGAGGIGTLGPNARAFVDILSTARMGLWQVLPLGPTGYGDAPYSALSAFAGNPLLIAVEPLAERGWLSQDDLVPLAGLPESHVDFGRLVPAKTQVLRLAFERYRDARQAEASIEGFREANRGWLDDFALY